MATRSASRAARRAMSLRLIICSGLTVAVTAEGVTAGGRDEPHVGANDLLPTDAGEFAALQDVQQFGLEPQRDLADLVEEERALIHRLEFAGLLPVGVGECALLVTEQLGFEQLAGKRRAIHLQELPMDARRRQVNGPGHDFLADSALTLQQYGDIESGHLRDQVPNRLHLGAAAEPQLLSHGPSPRTDGVAILCTQVHGEWPARWR